ncbi:MAG: acetate--CoA ligase family protein, partial [Candidatus Heimdallarchaeota archaeon]|nr:acetate--CoA ligase family protein [Candidatus Heimdallarchaeota archaeon]MCK5049198.1 acetate--CoA ligase family protein [Candidatus Heimdallarchaeota archaeon]
MAGSDSAYNAAFRKCGVLRAGSVEELFDAAFTISTQPLVSGKKIAIITNAGGPGIIATDEAERLGLKLADLSADTQDELRSFMAAAASWHNPVDVLGTAMEDEYDRATRICLKDDDVDMALVILTPQKQTTPKETADKIIKISQEFDKPIAAAYVGAHDLNDSILYMKQNGVPAFPFPERAIRALRRLYDYSVIKERNLNPPKPSLEVDKAKVREIIDYVRTKNRVNLLGSEANQIAKAYGIVAPITETAYTVEEAINYANQIGYPVVLKITSPDIVHKTDFGGVVLNVKSDEEVENHYHTILSKAREEYPDSGLLAIEVQEMSVPGKELIVGASQDPQFGHLVMIGLGGVYTNYFKDVAFELAPVSEDEAGNMLQSLRTYPILEGVRGDKPSDINAVKDTILRISRLVEDFPEILEMDVNPFFVFDKGNGISAVDVKITISPTKE